MSEVDINHLAFLAERGHLEHLCSMLSNPTRKLCLGEEPDDFARSLYRLCRSLDELPWTKLFIQLALFTNFLVNRKNAPYWWASAFEKLPDIRSLFPQLSFKELFAAEWRPAPVPMILGEARVRYMICGLLYGGGMDVEWPAWVPYVMDSEALKGIRNAGRAALSRLRLTEAGAGLYCYPLVTPNRTLQCRGPSVGLSVGLVFMGLIAGDPPHRKTIATGEVDEKGVVRAVGSIETKMNMGRLAGFRLFLYPAANNPPAALEGIEAFPVQLLEEAQMVAELYSPGRAGDLMLFSSMAQSPERFLANCRYVPTEWIEWLASERRGEETAASIVCSPEHLAAWATRLKQLIRDGMLGAAEALSALIGPQMEERAAVTSPMAMLRAHTWRMVLANRRGRPNDSLVHVRKAEAMLANGAGAADPEAAATFWNHRLLALHTRYDFTPCFPAGLKAALGMVEERFAALQRTGCSALPCLGALYGTLAQHFAFCGATYLPQTKRYARLAVEAFGGKSVPEHKADCLRQRNYLTYAYLDAGDKAMAEKELLSYVEAASLDDIPMKVSGTSDLWKKALVARFLAEAGSGYVRENFLDALGDDVFHDPKDVKHPRALYLFNLGRVALQLGREDQATALWKESVRCCLSSMNGIAVNVMALLPLSRLQNIDPMADQPFRTQAFRKIQGAAQQLNPTHFAPVLSDSPMDKLVFRVMKHSEELFPFSYR